MMQLSREERLLKIDGMTNIRDLGGYETKEGFYTKSHKFVRSTNPSNISDESKAKLYDYGIRTVVDLRSEFEMENQPHGLNNYDDIEYYHINILEQTDMNVVPDNIKEYSDLSGFYIFAIEANKSRIKEVFEIFASHLEGCIMFNCSAGKDRTGIIAALLLDLAGCHEYDIVKDYSESYENNLPIISKLEQMIGEEQQKYLGSSPDIMMKFLDYITETYGSAKAYLLSIGLDEEKIEDIKDNFII
ncbi:MAG: tyrosine-protein phosphatase [Thomasclavelia sp.]|nr:tyrosine-protein phosphatase [Thomasclavelia sp.]